MVTVKVKCTGECKQKFEVNVHADDYDRFLKGTSSERDLFPYLPRADLQLLINRVCQPCAIKEVRAQQHSEVELTPREQLVEILCDLADALHRVKHINPFLHHGLYNNTLAQLLAFEVFETPEQRTRWGRTASFGSGKG